MSLDSLSIENHFLFSYTHNRIEQDNFLDKTEIEKLEDWGETFTSFMSDKRPKRYLTLNFGQDQESQCHFLPDQDKTQLLKK